MLLQQSDEILAALHHLEAAAKAAGDDLAGILISALRHDLGFDQELPTVEFARAARRICDRKGAALIIDEVRAGFRLNAAGSWEGLGVRPDLSAWSKAIANSHALAAVTGADWLRCSAMLARGVYFHPKHNMFLCAAHTEADIAVALEAAEHGFATVAAL